VGSRKKRTKAAGATAFAVRVNAAARRALRRHRLSLTVRIAVTPPIGATVRRNLSVQLRAARR
jgi:hypothetical protein